MPTLREALDAFIHAKQADGLKPRTLLWYREQSVGLIRRYGDQLIEDVTTSDLRHLIIDLRDKAKSQVTANDKVIVLHVAWRWISSEYGINNPMARIKWPKRHELAPKAPSIDHVKALLRGMAKGLRKEATRNVAMLTLCIDTGMRISELLNLQIDDIDFSSHQIEVRNTKGGSDRVVPFSRSADISLSLWLKERPKTSDLVFPTMKGTRIAYASARQLLRMAHERAGLEKIYGWHSYRHFAARHYRLQSADIFDVQRLLGHKQINTTVQAYGNYIPDDLQAKHEDHTALNVLDDQKGI